MSLRNTTQLNVFFFLKSGNLFQMNKQCLSFLDHIAMFLTISSLHTVLNPLRWVDLSASWRIFLSSAKISRCSKQQFLSQLLLVIWSLLVPHSCSLQSHNSMPVSSVSSSTRGDYSQAGKKEKFRYATTLVFIQCIINAAFARLCESNRCSDCMCGDHALLYWMGGIMLWHINVAAGV